MQGAFALNQFTPHSTRAAEGHRGRSASWVTHFSLALGLCKKTSQHSWAMVLNCSPWHLTQVLPYLYTTCSIIYNDFLHGLSTFTLIQSCLCHSHKVIALMVLMNIKLHNYSFESCPSVAYLKSDCATVMCKPHFGKPCLVHLTLPPLIHPPSDQNCSLPTL